MAQNHRILSQRIHIKSGITSRPFAAPESAQVLAERGYFLEAGAERQFVGLDEDVMLDASFGVTHRSASPRRTHRQGKSA